MTRIAVVGTGISGLTAAWLLSRRHAVTVFEQDARPGGHTHTHELTLDGRDVRVDTGFIVYNDRNYPHFTRLLQALDVRGRPTVMSFSVANRGSGLEYNGHDLASLFVQRRNLINPRFLRMLVDILRFNRQAPRLLTLAGPGPSLADYLTTAGFGRGFAEDYLLPMAAAIWSVPTARLDSFPAKRVIEFFANHGLLSINDRPQWYVVEGGSRTYVDRILNQLTDVRLDCPVRRVQREDGGVRLTTAAGEERFDAVVLATHSDQALALLADPSEAEREILGAIGFQANTVVLHSDARVMPSLKGAWAAWNYYLDGGHLEGGGSGQVTVSYWMNQLQHIDTATPLLVTLNQDDRIDPAKVHARLNYTHPVFDTPAVVAQARRGEINGQRQTWYCGAWWRYGFHEDGCASAVDVARDFGVSL
ncbi:MAG: FAD-dependent oxidoreductase [Gammaproteobacteria bacterium]|nr:FAD-dependent oxidoreductase [Gammaproteobacteria bacterium]